MTPHEWAALLERAARRADIAATVALAAESIAKHESDAAALRTLAAATQKAQRIPGNNYVSINGVELRGGEIILTIKEAP